MTSEDVFYLIVLLDYLPLEHQFLEVIVLKFVYFDALLCL